jgi:hypothetical protein
MAGDVQSKCDKNVPTLEMALAKIVSEKRRCAASFSSRGSTLSLYYDPELGPDLWLFDSHGGHPTQSSRSYLVRCRDPPRIADVFRRCFPRYSNSRSDYDMVLFVSSEKEEGERDSGSE